MSKKLLTIVALLILATLVLNTGCVPTSEPASIVINQNTDVDVGTDNSSSESVEVSPTADDPAEEEEEESPPPPPEADYSDLEVDVGAIYFKRPEPTYNLGSCGASYLMEFDTVIVSYDLGNNSIRKEPSADSKKFGEVGPGTLLQIYGEPKCDKKHGVIYWKTNALGKQNVYVPESGGGEMWLTHIGNYDNVGEYLPGHLIDEFVFIVGILNNEVHSTSKKADYLEGVYWDVVNKYGEDTFLAIVDVLPAYTYDFKYAPAHFGYVADYVWWDSDIPKNSDFFKNMPRALAIMSNGTSGAELEELLGID